MKTAHDPRHRKRALLMQKLFSYSFDNKQHDREIQPILASQKVVDQAIAKAAPQWPLDKIARSDLAILRLSVYELLISRQEPPKVIIDEAVELAKEYGGEGSAPFVNGVLGTIFAAKEGN